MSNKEKDKLNLIIEMREAYCFGFSSIHKSSNNKEQF